MAQRLENRRRVSDYYFPQGIVEGTMSFERMRTTLALVLAYCGKGPTRAADDEEQRLLSVSGERSQTTGKASRSPWTSTGTSCPASNGTPPSASAPSFTAGSGLFRIRSAIGQHRGIRAPESLDFV